MSYASLKIGRYTIVKRIAIGGMAELYHARVKDASGVERSVAIKRILPLYASNGEFRKMFEYEAHLSELLKHPNIVQTTGFTELGSTYLLEMEYIQGVNLKQLMARLKDLNERLTVQWAVYFIREVSAGLEYAHTLKDTTTGAPFHIIHRDMSPQNIMIAFDGTVKIVDFGIAKAKSEADHTQTGVIKGKFAYMSPEQANGEEVTEQTDIFSVGISLWELLTGHRLFAMDNDLATLREVKEGSILKPSQLNSEVPAELDRIVMKALARDKKQRYQTARELHEDLKRFLEVYSPEFSSSHLSQHLGRIFAPVATQKGATPVTTGNFGLPAQHYEGDVFYEASESSITCFHPPTPVSVEEERVENSFTDLVLPEVTPETPTFSFGTLAATFLGVAGVVTAVYFLQDIRPLEKPTVQAGFSSREPASVSTGALETSVRSATLKVTTNRNVKIFLKGSEIAEAKAFNPVAVSLKGDLSHRLVFKDDKGLKVARTIQVKSGVINHLNIDFE